MKFHRQLPPKQTRRIAARTWSFSLPINGPSRHSTPGFSTRTTTKKLSYAMNAYEGWSTDDKMRQSVEPVQSTGPASQKGWKRGGVLQAPSAKQGIHLLEFCIDARHKGEKDREILGGWSFRSGWYPLAMLTRMPSGPRGGFFFRFFSRFFFLFSLFGVHTRGCDALYGEWPSLHKHAHVCKMKKGGGDHLRPPKDTSNGLARKEGYLLELLARSFARFCVPRWYSFFFVTLLGGGSPRSSTLRHYDF